jgi:hemolysin activation/secretion protein
VSFAHTLSGKRFRENIDAAPGDVLGAGVRFAAGVGEDPARPRLFGELHLEGTTGDFEYARAMLDATLNVPIFRTLAGAITGAGGTSAGDLPSQGLWYLGGTHTIRGQPIGTAAGNAFWMGRAELGFGITGVRTSVFGDLGWAGDRTKWESPGRPLSGAGIGLSFLDGMIRFDIARGINPTRGWRGGFLLDARF